MDRTDCVNLARVRLMESLAALLELRGLSQRAFVDRSGIPRSSLQAMLAGTRDVGVDRLERIGAALDVMVWRILGPPPLPAYIPLESAGSSTARAILSARIMSESTRQGLTLCDISMLSGCPASHLYDIVAELRCTGIDALPPVARVLRIELHELFVHVAQS